jgi:hypothetical protein
MGFSQLAPDPKISPKTPQGADEGKAYRYMDLQTWSGVLVLAAS